MSSTTSAWRGEMCGADSGGNGGVRLCEWQMRAVDTVAYPLADGLDFVGKASTGDRLVKTAPVLNKARGYMLMRSRGESKTNLRWQRANEPCRARKRDTQGACGCAGAGSRSVISAGRNLSRREGGPTWKHAHAHGLSRFPQQRLTQQRGRLRGLLHTITAHGSAEDDAASQVHALVGDLVFKPFEESTAAMPRGRRGPGQQTSLDLRSVRALGHV